MASVGFGDIFFTDAQQTADGGYVAVGMTYGGIYSQLVMFKYSADGVETWSKILTSPSLHINQDQNIYSIQQAADGGYLLGGLLRTDAGWASLIKTDSLGNVEWVKSVMPLYELEYVLSIEHTSDGGYVACGRAWDGSSSSYGMSLTKLDALEEVKWTRIYHEASIDEGRSVQQTADGGFIIAGLQELVKTVPNGQFEWGKGYSKSGSQFVLVSVQQTSDDGYIAIGDDFTPSGQDYACLVKTDNLGNAQWTKTVVAANLQSVRSTSDGWYIVGGYKRIGDQQSNFAAYLIKFGPLSTNTAPTITTLTVTPATVAVTKPVKAEVTFTDPDAGDAYTITWYWGDGTSTAVTAAPGTMSVSSSHAYTTATTYTVTCTVKDATDTSPVKTATVKVISQVSVAAEVQGLLKLPGVSAGDFVTAQAYNAYMNKLNALAKSIEAGNYADAQAKIMNDLMKRNDQWVKDPSKTILNEQLQIIYDELGVLLAAQG